jgi:ABC-2 type transport system ATP-binding protein
MIRTLLGFMHPTGGSAEIFGHDISRDSVAVRSMVGNLPGEFALEDRMTGGKLLKLFARLRGVESLDYAYELAERINAELDRPLRRLSRGNKQKIGLIQAMFHKPPLLILDEPTGGLDPLVQEEFLKIISETKEEGRTVFFSSHTLGEVERVCDRVGIIRDGELVQVETTDALINKSFRHVMLEFAETVGEDESEHFRGLEGVEEFKHDEAQLSFELHGNLDSVIKLAANHEVVDMLYERPSLEEIFLAYYGGDDETDDEADETDETSGTSKAASNGVPAPNASNSSGSSGNGRSGVEPSSGSRVESVSRPANPEASHNGSHATSQAAEAGIALQRAVETIVEQTVERMDTEGRLGRQIEKTAGREERS